MGPARFSEGAKAEWNALLFFVGSVLSREESAPARPPGQIISDAGLCAHLDKFSGSEGAAGRTRQQTGPLLVRRRQTVSEEARRESTLKPPANRTSYAMAVKSEKDLPESQRATWLKAMSAMELRNYAYAIQLLQAVLTGSSGFPPRAPACAQGGGGQVGRETERSRQSVQRQSFVRALSMMRIQSQVKKDPVSALDAIEKMLESEPYSPQANTLLKEAALAAKMPETATLCARNDRRRKSKGHEDHA